ncbi:FadR/GntR family transcriptional regulator [Lysinibacillus sp. KU-BSD001]|uniref:FadR/GntR family transcriptional regulator n=1 Tax=Lysinibacillus sp. KU-BSD001 TaxID=3141328 RepID=UPI0036E630B0
MAYKKIKTKKIYEEITDMLLHSIRSGELKPGDRLDSVEQLAEQLQVSRPAVREALSALKAMGLIEMKQGSGTFVKETPKQEIIFPYAPQLTKQNIEHLLEVRKILEVGTAGYAAKNRTEEDLTTLEIILEQMKHAHGNEELGEKTDFQFHSAIAKASQNPMLVNLLNQVSETMIEAMRETRRIWLYSKITTSEQLFEEHMSIYVAIKEGNELLAQQCMDLHLENVRATLIQYFESTNG